MKFPKEVCKSVSYYELPFYSCINSEVNSVKKPTPEVFSIISYIQFTLANYSPILFLLKSISQICVKSEPAKTTLNNKIILLVTIMAASWSILPKELRFEKEPKT